MKIIKREEWGAIKPQYPFKKHVPNKITIHNIGSSESPIIDKFKGAESIKAVDNYHVNVRKWNAIGYHYIIAPNGDIYEGRPDDVTGAHVRNNNTGNIGINVYCNSNVEVPTDIQIDTLKELLRFLTLKYGINKTAIKGHYQLVATDCPGKNIKRMLPEIIETFDTSTVGLNPTTAIIDEVDDSEITDAEIALLNADTEKQKPIVNSEKASKLLHEIATEIKLMNEKLAEAVSLLKE